MFCYSGKLILLVVLKEEVVVGILLDVELAHFVVEDLFEGVEVGALLGGDE